jgi:eukaryotic-like serine/threonine-protein kinase
MPSDALDRIRSALAGRYVVERELGAGGMATVYLATDPKHHRKVAVKVLRPELAAALGAERFTREIEIGAQLQHPHILPLLDSGDAGGILYYVMPYVDGESLRERLARRGELPIHEAVKLLCEVVDALSHAHGRGVVHRDIKPDNIMLSGRHALVMDFGVAKAVSEATGRQQLTTAGVALGTPAYMAPEQATADPHLDHRVDVYAIGALAYELLAGRPPFTGTSPQQVLAAHVTQPPEPITTHRPSISPALAAVVMKCLAKRPSDRWQSADELLAQLEPLLTPSGGMTPAETRPFPAARRRPPAWLLAALGGAAVLGVATSLLIAGRHPMAIALGRRTQVTRDPGLELDPALSPDGRFVAYAAGQPPETRILVRALGGGEAVTVSQGTGDIRQPRWSPDGSRIAYTDLEGVQEVAPLGGGLKRLVSAAGGATFDWSPDGSRIVFVGVDTMWVQPVAGGNRTRLHVQPGIWAPAWSPDGRWIAYVWNNAQFVYGSGNIGNTAPSTIYVMPAAGGDPVAITDTASLNVSPVWWPKGRRLLFVSNREGGRDVYSVELGADGRRRGAPIRLTTGLNPHTIALSASGDRLVYSVYSQASNIWRAAIPARGTLLASQATPLTSGSQITEGLAISPDGKWLAFDGSVSGNSDIWKMPAEGGSPQQLTATPEDEFAPNWSPDGREVAAHSFKRGNRDIVLIPAGGGEPRPVTTSPVHEWAPVFSPDGKAILFDSEKEGRLRSYITRRTADGGWSEPAPLTRRFTSGPDLVPGGKFVSVFDSTGRYLLRADALGDEPVLAFRRDSLPDVAGAAWAGDGKGLFREIRHPTLGTGIWYQPLGGGPGRMVLRVDDPALQLGQQMTASATDLFFILTRRDSDLWSVEVSAK